MLSGFALETSFEFTWKGGKASILCFFSSSIPALTQTSV